MKSILLFLLALVSFSRAGNYIVYVFNTNPTVNAGSPSIEHYFHYQLIAAGPLPNSTITFTNTGNGGNNTTRVYNAATGHFMSGAVIADLIEFQNGAINIGAQATFKFCVSTVWTGGQVLDQQTDDTLTRENLPHPDNTEANFNSFWNKDVHIYRSIIVYPPNWEKGVWNVQINTRSNGVYGKDYLVKWGTDETGQTNSVPSANPPVQGALLFTKTEQVDPELAPSKAVKIWRRNQGSEAWVLIGATTVLYGQTVIFNDNAPEALPAVGSDAPPVEAGQVGGNGVATGGTVGTGGSGLATPAPGSAGGGTQLTAAEVQEAVRQGAKQAANDSTGSGVTLSTSGLGDGAEGQDAVDAFGEAGTALGTSRDSLVSSGTAIGSHFTTLELPAVSTAGFDFAIPFPTLGVFHVDLTPHSSLISVIRALVLAVLTLAFFFVNIRVVRSTIG